MTVPIGSGGRVFQGVGPDGADNSPIGTGVGAPTAASSSKVSGTPGVTAAYDGMSDLTNDQTNGFGFEVTPPDQGLCTGYDPTLPGDPKTIFELVNESIEEIYPNGSPARPAFAEASFFGDPFSNGDIQCEFDATTGTWYFTQIGADLSIPAYVTDLLVLNSSGNVAEYYVENSFGGVEFPDYPHMGFDKFNWYLSTNSFNNYTGNYDGAAIVAASKSQLNAESANVNAITFGPLSDAAGIPVLSASPATDANSPDGYFVNSLPFDANGNSLNTANSLGVWELTGGPQLTNGHFDKMALNYQSVGTETYGFPVPAQSTGDGSIFTGPFSVPIQNETALNPDDDRVMSQVIGTSAGGDERLYVALCTALTPSGDTNVRDGVAWFVLRPDYKNVLQSQGYVAQANENFIYPAIYPTNGGNTIAFTETGPTTNPSAAYSVTNGSGTTVATVAAGSGPHYSFSGPIYNRPRWGDYSASAIDPNGHTVWFATEYIGPPSGYGYFDNWGTFIWSEQ